MNSLDWQHADDGIMVALGIMLIVKLIILGTVLLVAKYRHNPYHKISMETWRFVVSYAAGMFTSFIILGTIALVLRLI